MFECFERRAGPQLAVNGTSALLRGTIHHTVVLITTLGFLTVWTWAVRMTIMRTTNRVQKFAATIRRRRNSRGSCLCPCIARLGPIAVGMALRPGPAMRILSKPQSTSRRWRISTVSLPRTSSLASWITNGALEHVLRTTTRFSCTCDACSRFEIKLHLPGCDR